MKNCPSCQAQNSQDANFCGSCGANLLKSEPDHNHDPLLHSVVGGRYKVQEKIGSGGMGDVYMATHNKVGQKVAIKFLSRRLTGDKKIVQRFFNEARAIGRLTHPGVVTLNDFGQTDDGTLYIIMEYIEGEVLGDLVTREKFLSSEVALNIALQLCDVLDSAHQQGIIHRDLKPDNIMLTPGRKGRHLVKVLDFGIAKLVTEESDLTQTGTVYGTPEFMSPEQATGHAIDGRADLYAVASILYYMLVGRPSFFGEHPMAVMRAQAADPPKPPSLANPDADISPALEAIILQAMSKKPDQRQPTMGVLADQLEGLQLLRSGSIATLPPSQYVTQDPPSTRRPKEEPNTVPAKKIPGPNIEHELPSLEAPEGPPSFDASALGTPSIQDDGFGPASFGGVVLDSREASFDLGLGAGERSQFFDEDSGEFQRSTLVRSSRAPLVIAALVVALLFIGGAIIWASQEPATDDLSPDAGVEADAGDESDAASTGVESADLTNDASPDATTRLGKTERTTPKTNTKKSTRKKGRNRRKKNRRKKSNKRKKDTPKTVKPKTVKPKTDPVPRQLGDTTPKTPEKDTSKATGGSPPGKLD